MDSKAGKKIFCVSDDPDTYKLVKAALKELQVRVIRFSNIKDCLKRLNFSECDLLIVDTDLNKSNSRRTIVAVRRIQQFVNVLLLIPDGKTAKDKKILKADILQFLEKPVEQERLLPKVREQLNKKNLVVCGAKSLTPREKEVLQMILDGKTNKDIANILHRSVKTIEFHRYQLMTKLGVHNLAGLIKAASDIELK